MILQFFVTFLIKLRVQSQALFHFSLFNVSTTQYVSTVGFTATACNKVVLNKGANIGNFEDQVGRIISGKNLFPFSITFNDEINLYPSPSYLRFRNLSVILGISSYIYQRWGMNMK